MRRFGFADTAHVHRDDEIAFLRQLLEQLELERISLFAVSVYINEGRAIFPTFLRHKHPSREVDAGLGQEFEFFDAVMAARCDGNGARSQRGVRSSIPEKSFDTLLEARVGGSGWRQVRLFLEDRGIDGVPFSGIADGSV